MKKILVIEDHPDVRENTAEILTLAKYDVVTAPNGKAGVEMAEKERPDLILCDVMMPELDGFGVLHILSKKPELAAIPFIFLTAKAEKADVRKGMELGADDYLTKPFDDTELLSAIETRLHKQSLRTKNYSGAGALDAFIADARQALQLKNLCEGKRSKVFRKKSEIFTEGDTPASLFFVKTGSVKTFKSHAEGKDLITQLCKSGDFFGFESILQNGLYQESAVALEDSEIIIIPKDDFLTLIYSHPDVSAAFISLLSKKIGERETQLLSLAYSSVRQRTAEALLRLAQSKDNKGVLDVSRDDLSKIVGTASESVIRVLTDFKHEGLIESDGLKIKLLQPTRLEKVVRWSVSK